MRAAAAGTGALAAALLIAGCASPIAGSGRLATPTGSPGSTPSQVEPSRNCPSIVDPVAHLAYTCIDDTLERTFGPIDPAFDSDGTVMTLTTEPGWIASQQSGVVRAQGASAKQTAIQTVAEQVKYNYGDDPSAATVLEQAVPGLGREAYRLDQLVTLDREYVKDRQLSATSEMLSTVVVRLADGRYVAMSMSIPDTQRDWWTRFDSVIASLTVV